MAREGEQAPVLGQREPFWRLARLRVGIFAEQLWFRYSAAPDDWTPITVRPQHVFRHPDQIDADVGFVGKRISERMVAARMAVKFFERAGLANVTALPKDIKRLSILCRGTNFRSPRQHSQSFHCYPLRINRCCPSIGVQEKLSNQTVLRRVIGGIEIQPRRRSAPGSKVSLG